MQLSEIKSNPDNPRSITEDNFSKLVKSLKEFPKMMKLRPIIIDENNMILGGNMRLEALKKLDYKEIPDEWIKKEIGLTQKEKNEFIIKDNKAFGDWDFDVLANNFNFEELSDWGFAPMEIDFLKTDTPNVSMDIEETNTINQGKVSFKFGSNVCMVDSEIYKKFKDALVNSGHKSLDDFIEDLVNTYGGSL